MFVGMTLMRALGVSITAITAIPQPPTQAMPVITICVAVAVAFVHMQNYANEIAYAFSSIVRHGEITLICTVL